MIKTGELVTVISAHPLNKKWVGLVVDVGTSEMVKKHKLKKCPPLFKEKIYYLVLGKSLTNYNNKSLKYYVFVKGNLEKISL